MFALSAYRILIFPQKLMLIAHVPPTGGQVTIAKDCSRIAI
jgi:hypothetical protein